MRHLHRDCAILARRRLHKAACVLVAMLSACLTPIAGAQQTGEPRLHPLIVFAPEHRKYAAGARPSAFSDRQAAALDAIRSDPLASNVRIGRSDPAAIATAIDARTLAVAMPAESKGAAIAADTVIAFTGTDVAHNDEDLVSLYAQEAVTDSEVALVVQGPDVLGSIRRGDEIYKVQPLGDGLTAVYRYDTSRLRRHPPSLGGFMLKNESMQRQAPQRAPPGDAGTPGAATDTGDVIDLLVAYTPVARAAVGNIDTFIQFVIDNTHRVYRNSNIGLRLRLVHKHRVSYTEGSKLGMDLDRLTDIDGTMDEVHDLRDRYGADLVALIVGRSNACGVAWVPDFGRYPDSDMSGLGFSVTAHNCETSTFHTFAHELGHNQGAGHDPDNSCRTAPCSLPPPPTFQYRYGRCNPAAGWRTVMSYSSNRQGSCRREITYFSSPIVRYNGAPTGDAARRDNRRVLLETARRVANYRRPAAPTVASHTLPLVTAASNTGLAGFVRIINHSDRAGTVSILAFDDEGQRAGPVSLSLAAATAVHLTSADLESGNASKGLSAGIGRGAGHWRLELTSELNIEPVAYIRTPDGFLTGMHEMAAETAEGSNRYHVPFFNPASNTTKVSLLRLINPGDAAANIVITGMDDLGEAAPSGEVRLRVGLGAARLLTARQLEGGGTGITGRLGNGAGKWRLSVASDRPLQVMSLLQLETGQGRYLANLSRGQTGVSVDSPPPPPPPDAPDLVVQSPSVSASSLSAGQSFTLRATVRNQGDARSAATTLRWYISSDAAISTGDTRVGTDAMGALSASGTSSESIRLTAPSRAGTYYYGACVDSVSEESNTANNCSSGVGVTVRSSAFDCRIPIGSSSGRKASYCNTYQYRRGAIATGWVDGDDCGRGFHWFWTTDWFTRSYAESSVLSSCRRNRSLYDCKVLVSFTSCGAIAYGKSATHCILAGGVGTTRSAAERDALSRCRSAGMTPHAEEQSGNTANFLFGTSKSGPHPLGRIEIGEEVSGGGDGSR